MFQGGESDGEGMNAQGKVALVTGAGSGIGRDASLVLQAAGYSVVLAGRRAAELEATAAMAAAGGGKMLAVPTDVSDAASVANLYDSVARNFGRLDVLFNNAGVFAPGVPIEELPLEEWNRVVSVNMTGAILCTQHAIRMMKAQEPGGGRIINNGSISAHAPRPFSVPYTMTKHAMTGLTKCICLDGRGFDITASQIDIGNAVTERTERMVTGVPQADGSIRPEPRMEVRHVSEAVLYIANLPLSVNVPFMMVMATEMPMIGRG
jgi:NAD(P)-dependent dehydrogenase (short-subunit alcohol dehydrogenase family)